MKKLAFVCLILLFFIGCSSIIKKCDVDHDSPEPTTCKEKDIEKLLGKIAALYIFTQILND